MERMACEWLRIVRRIPLSEIDVGFRRISGIYWSHILRNLNMKIIEW